MSNEITCKVCGYENPHSSKFCNNCGTKLPLSTHIICPNCATPNTRDRVFCDTCGTRLVAAIPQPKAEEPEEDPPPANKPFSLPVRPPGETGELNPNAVPDWLRTGNVPADAQPDDDSTQSDKKDTSDLPDWLVHESDPEPIINAPTTISTEFYQDLLERAEDLPQPDDLFADDEEADLPDWLSDAAPVATPADVEASSGLTDWLSDLDSSNDSPEPADKTDDSASEGLTDWLHELDDIASPEETHAAENAAALSNLLNNEFEEEANASDWLAELGPAQTDVFAPQTDDLDAESAEDVPGWMDELGPLQTNLLDPSQITQITGSLTGMEDVADSVDDEEAGADISFTSLFETASDETETLPDWLDAATEEGESFLTHLPDVPDETAVAAEEVDMVSEADSDWFTAEQIVAETDLDWLTETGKLEAAADDEALDDLDISDAVPTPIDDSLADDGLDDFIFGDDLAAAEEDDAEAAADVAEADDLDWLTDMESIETGELVIEPQPEETAVVPDELDAEQQDEPAVESIEPQEPEEDSWDSESFLQETAVGEDLPTWLNQLDETGQQVEAAETASPDPDAEDEDEDEELPDWIASMRPSKGFMGSELPGVFSESDIRDTLEGIPEELAGTALPDWLQNTPLANAPSTPLADSDKKQELDIPDWLQPKESEPDTAVPDPPPVADLPESGSSQDEWSSLLEELPPLTPLAESLPKADIPEWVQQLKPTELTGEPPHEPQGSEEAAGPLKGMHGIVPIEPAIARPRSALPLDSFAATPEQEQQVALLRQIAQETAETVTILSTKTAYGTAAWLRVSLAILLIAVLLLGLRGPSLIFTDGPVPASVEAMNTAVAAAAGQPVLLAIEYTPAMAGELSPQAELLLAQLTANGSPVLITSQYAAGTAVASSLAGATNAQMVGYLPGESIGLRQLGDCLAQRTDCQQLNGRLLDDDLQTALLQTQLVIVLTADRDSLINWVEQVGSVATDVPIVAGVTQALAPLARSYATSGQLSGLLAGMPDAVAYEQLNDLPTDGLQAQLNAQMMGQLLAATLLLIGLLSYGTMGVINNPRRKNRR
jgi:Double zinc ribbon